MTGLNHATTGIVIALVVKRPEFALPLALLSHFVLDSIPHSVVDIHNKSLFRLYLIAEATAMIVVTIIAMLLFSDQALLIALCAGLAFLPDTLWPFYFFGNKRLKNTPGFKQFYRFHEWIQWSETYRGWLVDGLYFIVLVVFIVDYHTKTL